MIATANVLENCVQKAPGRGVPQRIRLKSLKLLKRSPWQCHTSSLTSGRHSQPRCVHEGHTEEIKAFIARYRADRLSDIIFLSISRPKMDPLAAQRGALRKGAGPVQSLCTADHGSSRVLRFFVEKGLSWNVQYLTEYLIFYYQERNIGPSISPRCMILLSRQRTTSRNLGSG